MGWDPDGLVNKVSPELVVVAERISLVHTGSKQEAYREQNVISNADKKQVDHGIYKVPVASKSNRVVTAANYSSRTTRSSQSKTDDVSWIKLD